MTHTEKDKQVLRRLGANIRKLRLHRGLTQEKLADLCGKSRHIIQKWECGDNMPPPGCLVTLTEALRVNWGTLFYGVGEPEEVETSDGCTKSG